MTDPLKTIREALRLAIDVQPNECFEALTALAALEAAMREPKWIDGVPHWTPALIAKVKQLAAEVDDPPAQQAQPVAWMYNRVGSELNPQLMKAGQEADDLRVGREPIMKPSNSHVDWVPLFAVQPAQQALEAAMREPCCVNYAAGTNCFSDPRIDCPHLPPAQQAQPSEIEVTCPVCSHTFYEWPEEKQAQPSRCTNSDSWNCKYCRKTESCEALNDPRNFGVPNQAQQAEAVPQDTLYLLRRLSANRHAYSHSELADEMTRIVAEAYKQAEAVPQDTQRLDWLEKQKIAYGFQGMHEGNTWSVDGPYRTVREAIDAATAAAPQPKQAEAVPQWQPIETLPVAGWDQHPWVLVYAQPGKFKNYPATCLVACHKEGLTGGAYWDVNGGKTFDGADYKPTHWMPLPAAPQPKEQRK